MKVITLDSRRRVSFGKIGQPEHTLYEAEVKPDGTIILRPVQIIPRHTPQVERNHVESNHRI